MFILHVHLSRHTFFLSKQFSQNEEMRYKVFKSLCHLDWVTCGWQLALVESHKKVIKNFRFITLKMCFIWENVFNYNIEISAINIHFTFCNGLWLDETIDDFQSYFLILISAIQESHEFVNGYSLNRRGSNSCWHSKLCILSILWFLENFLN